jgi:5-methyltetrahydrofolate--homocysteine methyltransferase
VNPRTARTPRTRRTGVAERGGERRRGDLAHVFPPGRTVLDGAMGTALLAAGLPAGALPEEWLLARPDAVGAVHAAHAAAGAVLLFTCTFNLAAPRLEGRLDPPSRARAAAAAVRLARAAAPSARVAGALGPTGLAGPGLPRVDAEVSERYARACDLLAAAGVDLLWLESQYDGGEAALALAAARATGLPAAITFTLLDEGGRFRAPDGTSAEALLAAAEAGGAAATGVNCVLPGPALDALSEHAAKTLRIPLALKPSPGLPHHVQAPAAFARALAPALAHARLAGGCCGASPAHLAALAAAWAR